MPLTTETSADLEAIGGEIVEHSRAVAELAGQVADELGMDPAGREEVTLAAMYHDVGKLEVPIEILDKPSALTGDEFELVKTHTIHGEAILERAGDRLAPVASIVRACHERWDGEGYPDGLAGEDIPLGARIVFCCDAYDAMTSDRSYRAAMGHVDAGAELLGCAGTQFDPDVVEALLTVLARRSRRSQRGAGVTPLAARRVRAA
ncbi:MAG TPA: HD-GYP domain-containing protein [Thermoleophilaceae bacterium]|nr:HD-GYP domain-containing protein [Thermoleophilaceae bacterium]